MPYLPTTTQTWRTAAHLWAQQRLAGRVTAEGLDGDLLIAAQAIAEGAAVVTSNEKHFQGIVHALPWENVLRREGE